MNKTKKIINEEDRQLIAVIQCFGFTPIIAKILVYLLKYDKAFSRDLEETMDIRQPEVNVGVKELRALGYVVKKEIQKLEGKGRPRHLYSLNKSKEKILHQIETEARDGIEEIEHNLQELKQLL